MEIIKELAACVPAKTKTQWFLQLAGLTAGLAPGIGTCARVAKDLADVDILSEQLSSPYLLTLAGGMGIYYAAKGYDLFRPKAEPGIWSGDMFFRENALWTGILITGRPGSGKTSGAIMPLAEQIFKLYTGPDTVPGLDPEGRPMDVENPYARLGGIVLEVKGEFYEMIAYQMHDCRRNVYEDLKIIRPDSRIPVAKFHNPETGHVLYANGLPCSTGSEAGILLMRAQNNLPMNERIRVDIFSCEELEFSAARPKLQKMEFEADKSVNYVGWRVEGNELVAVSHTPEFDKPAYRLDPNGKQIKIPIPKKLKFLDRVGISNGLIYGLVDQSVGANEAAEKLTRMASMSGDSKGGGDNSYWYQNAQRLIAACISLRRTTLPNQDVTCADIFQLVANDKDLEKDTKILNASITSLADTIKRETDPDRKLELQTRQYDPLLALQKYFAGEWKTLDEKTKGIIKTVVSNTFSNFVLDPALRETFCAPATFNFAECLQNGRVFCLVPGPKYEGLAKTIGTGLKLDFQQVCLQRLQRADYNKARPIIHLADECWNWAIAGGASGGDPKFLSLCRAARVINLLATQNYTQFVQQLQREATLTYLSCFGTYIWLQSFDKMTNEYAVDLMGTVKREKISANGAAVGALSIFDPSSPAAKVNQSWEDKRAFDFHDFVKLGGDEAIVFNGLLTKDMAIKTTLQKSPLTHTAKIGPTIAAFMRKYLRGSIEQALHQQKRMDRIDHGPIPPPKGSTPAVAAPAAPAPATAPTPTPPATTLPASAPTPKTPPKPTPSPQTSLPPAAPPPHTPPPASPVTPPPSSPPPSAPANPPAAEFRYVPPTYPPLPLPISLPQSDQKRYRWARNPESETDSAAGGNANAPRALVPEKVDAQSLEFIERWNRLANAARQYTPMDEYGLQGWVTELIRKKKEPAPLAPSVLVGPSGVSSGQPSLQQRATPLQNEVIDRLDPDLKEFIEPKRELAAAEAFQKQSGIPTPASWEREE